MRMIEQKIIQAVRDRKSFSTSYTQDMYRKKEGHRDVLQWSEYDTFLYLLWGHEIAAGDLVKKTLEVSDCGYPTATTTSRLNAIFAGLDIPVTCSVHMKIMQWYVNGVISSGLGKQTLKAGEWTIKIS